VSVINVSAREIVLKVVYYGPGLCGKTTSLQAIHQSIAESQRPEMVSIATEEDRTLFFDFLPVNAAKLGSYIVRLQLYTVPGQVFYNSTRKLVLRGADGVVFVADSQESARPANEESLRNLKENLAEWGERLETLPHVMQYNKRDLSDIVPLEQLDEELNEFKVPHFGTVAATGENVHEALRAVTRLIVRQLTKKGLAGVPMRRAETEPSRRLPRDNSEVGATGSMRPVPREPSRAEVRPREVSRPDIRPPQDVSRPDIRPPQDVSRPDIRPPQDVSRPDIRTQPRTDVRAVAREVSRPEIRTPPREVTQTDVRPRADGESTGKRRAPSTSSIDDAIVAETERAHEEKSGAFIRAPISGVTTEPMGVSFARCWRGPTIRGDAVAIEELIHGRKYDEAVVKTAQLVALAAQTAGHKSDDLALFIWQSGISGTRYARFRKIVRKALNNETVGERDALFVLHFATTLAFPV
jgi:mutual gliding-motility protein MglA